MPARLLTTLERTRSWLAEIRSINASVSEIGRAGLLVAFATGIVVQGILALSAAIGVTPHIRALGPTLGVAYFTVGFLIAWSSPGASRVLQVAAIAAATLSTLGGTWFNGVMALTVVPAVVSMFYLSAPGRLALGASGLLLIVAVAIEQFRHPGDDPAILIRAVTTSVATVVFWQLASGFWFRVIGRIHHLSTQIEVAASALDSERLEAERQATKALNRDDATGWLNRRGFIDTLRHHTAGGTSPSGLVAAVRLHAWSAATAQRDSMTQEALLSSLKSRLLLISGPHAVLARTGSDTYLAWWPITSESIDDALDACRRWARQLEPSVTSGVAVAPTQPRIGIAEFPADGHEISDVISKAETACTAASRRGTPEPVRFYTMLHTEDAEYRALERDVLHALRHDGFELHYQPIVSPTDPRLRKAEAFIRLQLPTRGDIPPELFIPLIEQTDLILDLTNWVMREAAGQVRRWRETFDPEFQISINVPPAYLMAFVREPIALKARLQSLGVPHGAMVLEITEGAMLDVTPEILRVLDMLRTLGFEIALDDFGVGYSHLSQLDKLRLNFLKLDKRFVANLGARAEQCPICEAIVMMAHRMGMQVVAEGVETETQRDRLVQLGTDYLQGYLYSKPLSATDFEAWVSHQDR